MLDCPANCVAVAVSEPCHDGVMPLGSATGKEQAAEHRSDDDGEDQSTEEREGDGPGHGSEETTFDGLQGEDGQVSSDDDADRVEDGALNFVSGFADLLGGREGFFALLAEMADDVLHHDDGAVDDHAEVQRTEGEEVGGDVAEVEADGGEEERERNGKRDDEGARTFPRKRNRIMTTRIMPSVRL